MAIRRIKHLRSKPSILKHFFIPGPHNVYRPLFLQIESAVVTAIIILILFALALIAERLVVRNPSPQIGAVVASVLVDLANTDRVAEGLPSLAVNSTLEKAAQMKVEDMVERQYFAHETPEGFSPWHWFGQAGYDFQYAGENLAVYFSDSAEVEKAWMNSPLHRENILSKKFSEVGIAIAHGIYQGNETTFVVQMFGNPSNADTVTILESQTIDSNESAVVAGASAEAVPLPTSLPAVSLPAMSQSKGSNPSHPKPAGAIVGSIPSTIWKISSSPKTTLQYVYMGLAALIFLALGLLFIVEFRRLHVPSLIRGLSLVALIVFLLYGGIAFSGSLLIL
ncbi:MAG: CAP domain-containing protein [Patescibacteria group bacterium]